MTAGASELQGTRVLVVEDETLVAMMIEMILDDWGCEVVGPVRSVDSALAIVEEQELDVALLDVNLGDEKVFPVADALARKSISFLFLTGHGASGIADRYRDRIVLSKPIIETALRAALISTRHIE